ncbi:MAG: hypothetical protein IID33_04710 [Planctomycetes bacterium]|nr:hypothetical protein [Planctomycetota bacterium]
MNYLAIMAYPFMPAAAGRLLDMLNIADKRVAWNPPPAPAAGHPLGETKILFSKLEIDAIA